MPWTYPPNYRDFSSADEYMRYWLAWEYKANPCFYRIHANCIGAALEVSYLLTKPWVLADMVFKQPHYDEAAGYFDPTKWSAVAEEAGFYDRGTQRWDDVTFFPLPGDLLSYAPWHMRFPKYEPQHMVVAVSHFSEGELLCFEKQSPGSLPQQYEIWYYQLRPCKSIASEWNRVYTPPYSIVED